jgi:mono/diheme cytochrome c family protein
LIVDIGGMLMLRLGLLFLLVSGFFDAAMADSAIERGDYLVNTILACGNCHTPRDANGELVKDKALSGGRVFSTPGFVVTTSNITSDVETGIGSWTDAEIKRALIEGIRPEHHRLPGVPLAAIMPANFYKALLPEDLDAIVAYLRSVKPVRNEITDPVYKAPVHRDPYPDAEAGFDKSSFTDPIRRGAYLITIGHCMECHSERTRGLSDYRAGLGRGGRVFPEGSTAANITSDRTAGIGAWTDQEIVRAVAHGVGRDGRMLKPPMGFVYYAGLKESDLADIIAYLRTVPPPQ